jgi:hypothetical protein
MRPILGVEASPFAWAIVAIAVISLLAVAGGAIGGVVRWLGALNTALLDDKTWFTVLLVLGLFTFGFVGKIAYVIAGPDGLREHLCSPFRSRLLCPDPADMSHTSDSGASAAQMRTTSPRRRRGPAGCRPAFGRGRTRTARRALMRR